MNRRELLNAAAALPLAQGAFSGSALADTWPPQFAKFVDEDSARLIAAVKKIGKVE